MMPSLIRQYILSLQEAKTLIAFATEKAGDLAVCGAIAVVDGGGHLICLERLDGTMTAASSIAIGKAATAMAFKRPGIVLEQTVTTDRPAMQTLTSVTPAPFVPLKGSYPIEVENILVGAVGVAGALTGDNDETIACFAIEKFRQYMAEFS